MFCLRLFVFLFFLLSLSYSSYSEEIPLPQYLVKAKDEWRYQVNPKEENWKNISFDDSKWKKGIAGFGYGDNDDNTIINIRGESRHIGIRKKFEVADVSKVKKLYLYVRYDDGFVAWINGQEITRASVERDGTVIEHEAKGFEEFVLKKPEDYLKAGKNVIAISGYNHSLNSSDFTLDPYLSTQPTPHREITVKEVKEDLAYLRGKLKDRSSYLKKRDVDIIALLYKLEKSIIKEIELPEFARRVQKIIAQIGDCHGYVSSSYKESSARYLPFNIGMAEKGLVAARGNSFFKKSYPYIKKIDGLDLKKWLDVAALYVSYGSKAYVYENAVSELRRVDILRRELKLPKRAKIKIQFANAQGETLEEELTLSKKKFYYAYLDIGKSRRIGKIGYLRIPEMDNDEVNTIHKRMHEFKNTEGLIIDVRGNGGGRYGIMQALYSYFMKEGAKPIVTNIAAYRKSADFSKDHLHYRPTHRLSWRGWNEIEREVIKETLKTFTPEWKLPEGKFSEWHFMLLRKKKNQYHYNKPVIVLSDAGCFSATDGFLSAFASHPDIILMGSASAGGSGSSRYIYLPNTDIKLRLSTMASFQRNGKLFDGNGVPVDIEVFPTAANLIGQGDQVLEKAIAKIKKLNAKAQ